MNEKRSFMVEVTGCWDCPNKGIDFNVRCCLKVSDSRKAWETFAENKDRITPTCPMWIHSKPIGDKA